MPFQSLLHHLVSGANTGITNFIFIFNLNMYEDFLQLGMNCLQNYLSVRGLNIIGRKIELVAQAFAAFEMKLPIIPS